MKIAIAHLKFPAGEKNSNEVNKLTSDDEILLDEMASNYAEIRTPPVNIESGIDPTELQHFNCEEIKDPEENWKNKNRNGTSQSIVTLEKSKPLQKRRAKFSILNAQKVHLSDPIPILANGFSGKGMITYNTCAFDCIFSAYACLYRDYAMFQAVIDSEKSFSQICAFIAKVLEQKKVLKNVYNDRNKILYDLAGQSEKRKQLTTLDCETGFGGIFSQICKKNEVLASSIMKRTCDKCELLSKLVRLFLPLLCRGMDIRNLQAHIIDPTTQDEFCPECKNLCIAEHHFNPVLALEVEPISEKHERKFRVENIPEVIEVDSQKYNLCGVVEAKPKHFISHMLRKNFVWETYDNLSTNVSTMDPSKEINIFMLFYIKSGECYSKFIFSLAQK